MVRPTCGYAFGVKTAISVPDDVYASAERLALERGVSRSALYRSHAEEPSQEQDPAVGRLGVNTREVVSKNRREGVSDRMRPASP